MNYLQYIVQTNNERSVNRFLLLTISLLGVLFLVYSSLMYQVTSVAYEIRTQDSTASEYLEQIADLENNYHTRKLSLNVTSAYERGFDKIGTPQFILVERQAYSLAR